MNASWNEALLALVHRVSSAEWSEMMRLQREGATPREAADFLMFMRGDQ